MDIQSGGHGSQTKLQFNEGWFHTFMYLVVQKKNLTCTCKLYETNI